jgi:hypothetical protein
MLPAKFPQWEQVVVEEAEVQEEEVAAAAEAAVVVVVEDLEVDLEVETEAILLT